MNVLQSALIAGMPVLSLFALASRAVSAQVRTSPLSLIPSRIAALITMYVSQSPIAALIADRTTHDSTKRPNTTSISISFLLDTNTAFVGAGAMAACRHAPSADAPPMVITGITEVQR